MRFRLMTLAFLLSTAPAFAGQVVISINENSQEMTVTLDGQQEYVWPVSTGVSRYATPSGKYTPFRMEEFHFSDEWDDAAMPYSIFFTRSGHAIHGTEHIEKLGKRASHGCVRLDPENAATLFALVQEIGMPNTTVVVSGNVVKKGVGKSRIAKAEKIVPAPAQLDEFATLPLVEKADSRKKKRRQLWAYERAN